MPRMANSAMKTKRDQLHKWLVANVNRADVADLLHHLGDILESCQEVEARLKRLPRLDLTTTEGRESLAALHGELAEHLLFHVRSVRAPLGALVRRSFAASLARIRGVERANRKLRGRRAKTKQ